MPTYEYRCENDHVFEVIQRMADDPVTKCEVCGAPVQRVFYPVAVHFKGSGFYSTDYGRNRGGGNKEDGASKSESSTPEASKSDSPKESTTSKSESSSDSSSGSSSGDSKSD